MFRGSELKAFGVRGNGWRRGIRLAVVNPALKALNPA